MVKFNYNFQNILNIKEKMEDQKKMALSEANKQLTLEENRMDELQGRLDVVNKNLRDTMTKGVTVGDIRLLGQVGQYVHTRIKEQHLVIEKATMEVEQKRQDLHVALMERQMFEKLKEKAYEQHLQEANIEEQKSLDEIVSYKYRKPAQ